MLFASRILLLALAVLNKSVQGFLLATPKSSNPFYSTPAGIGSTQDEAWNEAVIDKLQAWASDMRSALGSNSNPVPTAHIQRTPNRFTANISFEDDSIAAETIDIRLVTVGQHPYIAISSPEHHQGVALDSTMNLDTLKANLLPGNILQIEADKKAPRDTGLRIPVVDKRG